MQVSVTFKNLDPTPSLKEYAENKILKSVKFDEKLIDAQVFLSTEAHNRSADITLIGSHGLKLRAQVKSDDMYGSIDKAVDKIIRQLRRHKEKLKSHKAKPTSSMFSENDVEAEFAQEAAE